MGSGGCMRGMLGGVRVGEIWLGRDTKNLISRTGVWWWSSAMVV